jgi:hypothetical protein
MPQPDNGITREASSPAGGVDLDDGDSVLATEREILWMWLADLESRVGALEELMGVPYNPVQAQRQVPLDSRIGELEELSEFLPSLFQLQQRTPLPGEGPLW